MNQDEPGRPAARWLPFLLLALAVVVLHWPGGAGFKSDDYLAIRYASDWGNVWRDCHDAQYGLQGFRFYRPFTTFSFGLDFALFGTDPFGYFAASCLALLVSAMALLAILRALFGAPLPAFALTLLWVCHPALVPSQRWAVGRVDTHTTALILVALWLHLRCRRGGPGWPVFVAGALALASKENAVGLPLLALGLDVLDPRPAESGSRYPGLRYLPLVAVYLLLRYAALGEVVGGYTFRSWQEPLDLGQLLGNFGAALAGSLVPGATLPLAAALGGLLVVAGTVVCWRAGASGRRAGGGLLLVAAGLFGPLYKVVALRPIGDDLRWFYLGCLWMPAIWVAVAWRLGRGRGFPAWFLPLLWLLPSQLLARAAMDEHDRVVGGTVKAMHEVAAMLEPGEPVVLTGDVDAVMHPYRLSWWTGTVLRPPFTDTDQVIVTLRSFAPAAAPVATGVVCDGLPAWVEVDPAGSRIVRGARRRTGEATAVGHEGVLRGDLLEPVLGPERIGWAAGADFRGPVILCTAMGSALLPLQPVDGVLMLRDVLAANLSNDPAQPMAVHRALFSMADFDPGTRLLLRWQQGDRRVEARLACGADFVRAYMGLLDRLGVPTR